MWYLFFILFIFYFSMYLDVKVYSNVNYITDLI